MIISVKRAYDAPKKSDGLRVLVDRLWPRGVTKAKAQIDLWAKNVAPSTALRTWFHGDPEERYGAFTKKYRAELAANKAEIRALLKTHATATLVTAVKDIEHSHIPTLKKFLSSL